MGRYLEPKHNLVPLGTEMYYGCYLEPKNKLVTILDFKSFKIFLIFIFLKFLKKNILFLKKIF